MIWCYFTTQCFTNDSMPKKFCTSESLYNVHQWSRIIPIQLSVQSTFTLQETLINSQLPTSNIFLFTFIRYSSFSFKDNILYHVELTFMSFYTCILQAIRSIKIAQWQKAGKQGKDDRGGWGGHGG